MTDVRVTRDDALAVGESQSGVRVTRDDLVVIGDPLLGTHVDVTRDDLLAVAENPLSREVRITRDDLLIIADQPAATGMRVTRDDLLVVGVDAGPGGDLGVRVTRADLLVIADPLKPSPIAGCPPVGPAPPDTFRYGPSDKHVGAEPTALPFVQAGSGDPIALRPCNTVIAQGTREAARALFASGSAATGYLLNTGPSNAAVDFIFADELGNEISLTGGFPIAVPAGSTVQVLQIRETFKFFCLAPGERIVARTVFR